MQNVYESCPVFEDDRFEFRLLKEEDIDDLLEVYSDKNALPFFNSDNCDGDPDLRRGARCRRRTVRFHEVRRAPARRRRPLPLQRILDREKITQKTFKIPLEINF